MKIDPEKIELVRLWDEEAARDCSHSFVSTSDSVFEAGLFSKPSTLYRCRKCGQLRKARKK